MEDKNLIDQSQLAKSIADKIKYEMVDMFLVKQLEPIKVKKEFTKPVSNGPAKEKDGIVAQDYDKVETEVKEVESDFREGVVIKVPMSFTNMKEKPFDVQVGDVVLFASNRCQYFDLLKDSRLVNYYNILAIKK